MADDQFAELVEKVQEHETHLAVVKHRLDDQEGILDEMRRTIERLDILVAKTATTDDINALRAHMDASALGLLKDALAAVPQYAAVKESHAGNKWLRLSAIVAVASLGTADILWLAHHVHFGR